MIPQFYYGSRPLNVVLIFVSERCRLIAMSWQWQSVKQGARQEYGGWRAFRRKSGIWPLCSMLTTIVIMPFCFTAGLYGFIEVLDAANGRLAMIYFGLLLAVSIPAFLWFASRRLANHLDVQRAERHHKEPIASGKLGRLIE